MKAIKTFFVWILLLALPLQGFAAVATSVCRPGAALAAAASAKNDHGVAHSDAAANCGHHQSAPPVQDDKNCDSASDATTCSACAACSVGASIAAAFAPLPAFNAHGAESIPYVAAHDTGCIYGALERPPHTLA
jgi:hypothetical protein